LTALSLYLALLSGNQVSELMSGKPKGLIPPMLPNIIFTDLCSFFSSTKVDSGQSAGAEQGKIQVRTKVYGMVATHHLLIPTLAPAFSTGTGDLETNSSRFILLS